MYGDTITDSMRRAITETNRRRFIQQEYNVQHNIVPKTIIKKVHEIIKATEGVGTAKKTSLLEKPPESMSRDELLKAIKELENKMRKAASDLRFEEAAECRDKIVELKKLSLM
jgi:excinuclease ABC subunit B